MSFGGNLVRRISMSNTRSNLSGLYKSKTREVNSVETRRKSRGVERKECRGSEVNRRRGIDVLDDGLMSPVVEDGISPVALGHNKRPKKVTSLQDRLQQWREEKKKKQELSKKNKPVFSVSGVRHKVESDLYAQSQARNQRQKINEKNGPPSKVPPTGPAVKSAVVTRTRTARATSGSKHVEPDVAAARTTRKTKAMAAEAKKPDPVSSKGRKAGAETNTKKNTEVSGKLAGKDKERKAKPLSDKPEQTGKARDLSSRLTAAAKAKMNEQKHTDFLKAKPRSRPTRSTRKAVQEEEKQQEQKIAPPMVAEETSSSSDSQTEVPMLESTTSRPRHSTPFARGKAKQKSSRRKSTKKEKAALNSPDEDLSIIVGLEDKRVISSDEALSPPSKKQKNESGAVSLDGEKEDGHVAEAPALNEGPIASGIVEPLAGSFISSQDEEMDDQEDLPVDPAVPPVTDLAEAKRNMSLWAQPNNSYRFGNGDQRRGSLARLSMGDNVLERSDKENKSAGTPRLMKGRRNSGKDTVISEEKQDQQVSSSKKVSGTPRRKSRRATKDHQSCDVEKPKSPAAGGNTPRRKSMRVYADSQSSDNEHLNASAIVKTPRRKSSVKTPKEKSSSLISDLKESQSSEADEIQGKSVKRPRRKSCVQSPAFDLSKGHAASDGEVIKMVPASRRRRSSRVSFAETRSDSETPQSEKPAFRKTPYRRSIRLMADTTESSDQETVLIQSKSKRRSVRRSLLRKEAVEEVYHSSDPTDSDTQAPLNEDDDVTPISQQRQHMGSALAKKKSLVLNKSSTSSNDESDHPSVKKGSTPRSGKKRQSAGTPGKVATPRSSKRLSTGIPGKVATPRSLKRLSAGTPGKVATSSSSKRRSKRHSRRVSGSGKSLRRGSSTVVSVNDEGTEWLQGDNVIGQVFQSPGTPGHENRLPVTPKSRSRRSTVVSVSDEGTSVAADPLAYQVKQASAENDSRILQELVVEKVEGETSFIEVPLESSVEGDSDALTTSQDDHQSTQPFTPHTTDEGSVSSKSSGRSVGSRSSSKKHVHIVTPEVPAEQGTPKAGKSRLRGRSVTPYTFKEPGTPVSALRNRSARRRKTEHSTPSKSPEEMLEILRKSPMVEMSRRRSRHASSPGTPSRFEFSEEIEPRNLSAPELSAEPQPTTGSPGVVAAAADNAEVGEELSAEPLLDDETADRVKYFRDLLESETARLKGLCTEWEEVNCYTFGLSEEVQGQIRSVVGKAQLLMDQRFKQFSGLVDACQFKTGEQKTTPNDLQGFWEMIYFQVEDVNTLFVKLHELRMNNWEVKQPTPKKKVVVTKKKAPGPSKPPKRKGNFAAFRAAMIKNKAGKNLGQGDETKEFDAGFFKVNSPVRSPGAAGLKKKEENITQAGEPLSKTPSMAQAEVVTKKKAASPRNPPKKKNNFAVFRAAMMKYKAGKNLGQGDETKEFDDDFLKVNSPVRSPGVAGIKKKNANPLRSAPEENSTQAGEPLSKTPSMAEDNTAQPVLGAGEPVNKENELASAPTSPAQSGFLLSASARRLQYQPKVDSPLLNDITDLS